MYVMATPSLFLQEYFDHGDTDEVKVSLPTPSSLSQPIIIVLFSTQRSLSDLNIRNIKSEVIVGVCVILD